MKSCSICKESKGSASFYKNRAMKDGLQSYCKDCSLSRRIKYYKANKSYYKNKNKEQQSKARDYLKVKKQSSKCSKCSESRWYVLDFHHKEANKKLEGLSAMVMRGYSLENIQKEIEKCVLLCANCHRELHFLEKQNIPR